VDKALEILSQWNRGPFITNTIRLNKPEIWKVEGTGQRVMVEPFIENYKKFNSNTGWVNPEDSSWIELFQVRVECAINSYSDTNTSLSAHLPFSPQHNRPSPTTPTTSPAASSSSATCKVTKTKRALESHETHSIHHPSIPTSTPHPPIDRRSPPLLLLPTLLQAGSTAMAPSAPTLSSSPAAGASGQQTWGPPASPASSRATAATCTAAGSGRNRRTRRPTCRHSPPRP
jgi:hypothetical protein